MSIIFILAALGITFGYTNPAYRGSSGDPDISKKSVTELLDEKVKYESALEKTREIEEVRNGLLTKYNSVTDADRQKLTRMLPSNIDSIRLIIDVNNVASAYGMSLRDVGISDAPVSAARKDNTVSVIQSAGYSYVTLTFSVTGTYDNLILFLSDLERSLRVNDVTSLSVDSAGDDTKTAQGGKTKIVKETPKYKMKVSLKTYFLPAK